MANEDVLLTEQEKQEIKNNAPDQLPLNPTAQGFSGAFVRKKTSAFVTGDEKSVLKLLGTKFEIIKALFDEIDSRTIIDDLSTEIDYIFEDNTDKTYTQEELTLTKVTIPSGITHGFTTGLNYKSGGSLLPLEIINNSSFELKIFNMGMSVANYVPTQNKVIDLVCFCDGIYVYCYIKEI